MVKEHIEAAIAELTHPSDPILHHEVQVTRNLLQAAVVAYERAESRAAKRQADDVLQAHG